MAYAVTSWFVEQCRERAPTLKRQFFIGASDYSSYVARWPAVSHKWDDIRPQTCVIGLSNEEQTFNFIRTDTTQLRKSCSVKAGFTHPTSGDELVTMFSGTMDKVSYAKAAFDITLVDKMKQLGERILGSTAAPISITASGTLPSDIAWTVVTCYGGFSSIQSTSNPDIDYAAWQVWAGVFSNDNAQMNARFEGQKCTEALRKIGRHTISSILMLGDKLTFQRFTAASSIVTSFSNNDLLDLSTGIDDQDMINRQYLFGAYNQNSQSWGITVFDTHTPSVNSYGLREEVEKDESVWYINSASGLNFVQRITNTLATPFERVTGEMPMVTLYMTVGDLIGGVEPQIGINDTYRIMQRTVNLDNGVIRSTFDKSQLKNAFTLDQSSLDGSDVLL